MFSLLNFTEEKGWSFSLGALSYILGFCLHPHHKSGCHMLNLVYLLHHRANICLLAPCAWCCFTARTEIAFESVSSQKEVTFNFVPHLHLTTLLTVTCAHSRGCFQQISIGFHRSTWRLSIGCQNWKDDKMKIDKWLCCQSLVIWGWWIDGFVPWPCWRSDDPFNVCTSLF